MTWGQIWILLDAHSKNQAAEAKASEKADKTMHTHPDVPEKPDADLDPVGALRWELTYWPKLSQFPIPQLSEEQINEACLKLEQKLKAESEAARIEPENVV